MLIMTTVTSDINYKIGGPPDHLYARQFIGLIGLIESCYAYCYSLSQLKEQGPGEFHVLRCQSSSPSGVVDSANFSQQ